MTSIYQRTHPNEQRNSTIYTPERLADQLHSILTLGGAITYPTVLDPAIGQGNLVYPFRNDSEIIGADIDPRPVIADKFRRGDFCEFKRWDVDPDLIMVNPPFNGNRRMLWPEKFLRQILKLFGPSVPILMFVPVGFRFNQRRNSGRRKFLRDECPPITSICSLPLDVFPEAQVFSEILMFNMPYLEPHYVL